MLADEHRARGMSAGVPGTKRAREGISALRHPRRRAAHRGTAAEGVEAARRSVCRRPRRGSHQRGFLDAESAIAPFATPRRLAVAITKVVAVASDTEVVDKLMPAKVALDASGQPSEALEETRGTRAPRPRHRSARRAGRDRPHLRRLRRQGRVRLSAQPRQGHRSHAASGGPRRNARAAADPEGDELCRRRRLRQRRRVRPPGAPAPRAARRRRRPVDALGLAAGRLTGGHRFLGRGAIEVATAEAYAPTLERRRQGHAGFADAARPSSPASSVTPTAPR